MSKSLAGKKAFYAMGQSDADKKLPITKSARNQRPGCWPDWAKLSYMRGYHRIGPK